jgi:hypothetical protein
VPGTVNGSSKLNIKKHTPLEKNENGQTVIVFVINLKD